MTTQQDSVDVERLRAAHRVKNNEYGVWWNGMTDHQRRIAKMEDAFLAGALAALSLPITQRDEQAKTYADALEDAVRIADAEKAQSGQAAEDLKGDDLAQCVSAGGYMAAGRIATAIRRLSIEQGDQDGRSA